MIITDQNYSKEIDKCKTLIILDFYAPWCNPCKLITPIIEEISKIYENKLTIFKINVDNCPDMAQQYNIMSIPTIIFMDINKKIVNQLTGFHNKEEIMKGVYEITKN